jgi:imidazole glycerol-phosphate synthase subunit HisH
MITIIDYGMGNLASVYKAFKYIGQDVRVSDCPKDLDGTDAVVLPGVGAMRDAMINLNETGFSDAIFRYIKTDRPFLGICLGLQMLFETTEEGSRFYGDEIKGLGIIKGKVRRFPDSPGIKIPHMGWNLITDTTDRILPEGKAFYFVHSYHVCPIDPCDISSCSFHGVPFVSSITKNNIRAFQFHPEKSGDLGIRLLREWSECFVIPYKGSR